MNKTLGSLNPYIQRSRKQDLKTPGEVDDALSRRGRSGVEMLVDVVATSLLSTKIVTVCGVLVSSVAILAIPF